MTSSRRQSRGIPKTHDLGFCFLPALRVFLNCPLELCLSGLTSDPQTITASPAASIFFPALMSLSIPFVSQLGQSKARISKGNLSIMNPQWLHRLLLGKNRSILTNVRPYQSHLYSRNANISPQAASPIERDNFRFFIMFLTAGSSIAIKLYEHSLASSQLVQKIGTSIFNKAVYSSYFKSRFLSVVRAFGFPTQFLLRARKLLIQSIEMLGISYLFTVASTNQTGYASIDTNLLFDWWQYFDSVVIYQQRNKPTSRGVEFDCNCRRTTAIRQNPRPNYWQRFFAFSKPKLTLFILKSRLGKLSRTTITFFLESWVFSSLTPKVSKRFLVRVPLRLSATRGRIRFLQMPQALLQRYAANFVKKNEFFGFLPVCKKTRGFLVLDSLLSFVPSFSPSPQSFVIYQPYASHCPSQEIFLLGSGKKSVFVSSFNHSSHFIILNANRKAVIPCPAFLPSAEPRVSSRKKR